MSDASDTYWLGVAIGTVAGWLLHSLILQLGYKLGIVEYRGARK